MRLEMEQSLEGPTDEGAVTVTPEQSEQGESLQIDTEAMHAITHWMQNEYAQLRQNVEQTIAKFEYELPTLSGEKRSQVAADIISARKILTEIDAFLQSLRTSEWVALTQTPKGMQFVVQGHRETPLKDGDYKIDGATARKIASGLEQKIATKLSGIFLSLYALDQNSTLATLGKQIDGQQQVSPGTPLQHTGVQQVHDIFRKLDAGGGPLTQLSINVQGEKVAISPQRPPRLVKAA